jgi:prolyl oligopeptidase
MLAPSLLVSLLLGAPSVTALAPLAPAPPAERKPVVDKYDDLQVTDDYRWLEQSSDPKVQAWSDAQNTRARAWLEALPHRAEVFTRIDALVRASSVSYSSVAAHGGKLFALKHDPKVQQPLLVVLASPQSVKGERVLVDPNALDAKGGIAIDWFVPSTDGKRIAVSLSQGGSEAGDLHLYDVDTGKEIFEVVPRVQNGTGGGSVAFAPDGSGVWYTRYPRGTERPAADAGFYQQVWFHAFGTDAARDVYELGKELPKIAEIELHAKDDGSWVLAEVKNGDGGEVAFYVRPAKGSAPWQQLSTFADKIVQARFGDDDALYLLSRKDAPMGKLLRLPLATPTLAKAVEIVPPSDGAIEHFVATKSRLYVADLLGGPSRLRLFDLEGKSRGVLTTAPVSSVGALVKLSGDDVLAQTSSFIAPPAWVRFDGKSAKASKTALTQTSIADFSDTEVVRAEAVSKDGTKIPVSIIKKKKAVLDGTNPTLLWGYGGYAVSQKPSFSPVRRAWIEQGGIFVVAHIRGGGELGDAWHLAGNLTKKQNVFDDFDAVAQFLIAQKYTSPAKLAAMGGSNGGLLMGAAFTQHPERFRAVVSMVGIYDMLRVELTPNGQFNVPEFGTVKDKAQRDALFAYSPYHHVKDGTAYPSVLFTSGANDPRVDPWHSRKMVARLQAATSSSNPILLRTNANAGHGMGSSLDVVIAERADVYAFLFHELGVDYRAVKR